MKNVIVTGANSGLGYETAKKIAADKDYRIIMACRNQQKAADAQAKMIAESGNQNIEVLPLDTSSLSSVTSFVDEFTKKYDKVDVLINNAGITAMGNSGVTEDGFELVFATNYLGHFLLTQKLLPYLAEGARIYNVSSDMHNPPGGISWPGVEALAHPKEDDRQKYSYSKLCMIYLTHELNKYFAQNGIKAAANSFNPGFMSATNFAPGGGKIREAMVKTTMPDRFGKLETSSDALAELATSEKFAQSADEYFDRSTNAVRSSDLSYDEGNARELWDASLKYCGLA